ncbi:hypothetical protein LSCM1_02886 [Leishmania martiniquensis]|uniref:Uncharacterized protein n=1 Tax=Leishmania martiniquensis TaxID=1580590 RepID=A0A836H3W4_9TRYP|nr:hypothetical protein LSCM1_02886 [Leishmania martiniquensis]
MPASTGLTVAEQVAALPPLSQLLCIPSSELATPKSKGTQKARARRMPYGAGVTGSTQASSTKIRPACAPQQPSSRLPAVAPLAPTSLATTADVDAPRSLSEANEEREVPTTPSTPLLAGNAGGLREWRRVKQSLQLPLMYRAEEDVHLSLRLLRSLPFFAPLQEDDLLTLAETMQVIEVPGTGTVLLRKPAADDAGCISSSAAALALPPAAVPSHAPPPPSLSTETLHAPQLLEEEEPDSSQQVRTIPAAHLFSLFKEQIRRGEPPSLPPECTQRGVSDDVDNALAPMTLSDAARAAAQRSPPQSVAGAARQLTTGNITSPLFSRRKHTRNDDSDGAFVMVLLRGHCHLTWPRERGPMEDASATSLWHRYQLQAGDAMGYALIWEALPPATEYVTSEASMLLIVSSEGRMAEVAARLRRVLRRANEALLREQRRFLAEDLRLCLFGPDEAAAETSYAPNTYAGGEASDQGPSNPMPVAEPETISAVPEPVAPSIASLLEIAARHLIPIRVPSQAVLLREGLVPLKECAIYFLVDGGLTVVRRIWTQDQQRLLSDRAQLVRVLTPATGVCPPLTHLPATDSMEVAQLRPGDYCGDLAYLDADPDHVASIDAEWTAAYWQSTLAQPTAPPQHGGDRTGAHPQFTQEVARCASDDDHRSIFRRHRATVVAKQASSLYVLLPPAADQALVGLVLQRMRDRVERDYVGYQQAFAEYEKVHRWAVYKERVLYEVSQKAPLNFR